MVPSVNPSRLPVLHIASPSWRVVGISLLPAVHIASKVICPDRAAASPTLVVALASVGVNTALPWPLSSHRLGGPFLFPRAVAVVQFIGETCLFDWHRVSDVVQSVNQVQLRERDVLP